VFRFCCPIIYAIMGLGLCKYKDVFGAAEEGVHAVRLFGMAAIDLVLTVLLGMYIAWHFHINFVYVMLALFCVAILAHRLFCVNTAINKLLFGPV
jgi:hypothetical protein